MSSGQTPLLEVRDVVAAYGPVQVLYGVSLAVGSGEAVGVLGANGAGKSTLMRVLSGQMGVQSGSVLLEGKAVNRVPTPARVRRGIVHVAEGHAVVGSLTVEENLALGAIRFWPRGAKRAIAETMGQVKDLFPVLADRPRQLAGSLSGGEQQMLAIGRALMAKPRVLLLDEPSLGLAPVVVDQIYETMERLRELDLAIVLVEQNSDVAQSFCDRVYVLRLGEIVAEGARGELGGQALREAYFGVA